ncbi:MAG: hypothetical protein IT226_08685 [Flavobacteriales bacterium]|nr:hypothetical protein [Flavobacteriales bacterium]
MTKRYAFLIGSLLFGATSFLQAQSGTLDPSFNGTGYVIDPVNNLDAGQKILVQPDQKILLIGMSFDAQYVARAQVYRYNPDGSRDTGFGINGVFTYELDFEADLYSAVLTADGKIILAGSTTDYQTYRLLLIQLNADGTLDDSFAGTGVLAQSVSVVVDNAEDMAYDLALDADGNILVCGSSYDANYIRRPIVVRFTPDGQLDTGFGTNGVASIPAGVGSSGFRGIVVQADGKILASGFFGAGLQWFELLLVRYEADGSLDASFGNAGVVQYNYGNVDDEGYDLALAPDGSILVAGVTVTQTYNYSALLMKFTADGAVDISFGTDGAVEEDLNNFDLASNVSWISDGTIIMAGSSGVGPPNGFDMAVWKYLPDGTRDNSFGTNGLAAPVIPDRYAMINAMEVQADGRILVGGQARTTVNVNNFLIARLQNDITNSVAELSSVDQAYTFPNPASAGSTVTVQLDNALQPIARIELYAADGRRIHSYSVQQLARTAQGVSIQLPTDVAPGIYQLAFGQPGARSTSTIIIAQ